MIDKESIVEIRNEIDTILKKAGVEPSKIEEFKKKLGKLEKENERKLLASEVIKEFFKPLLSAEEVVKAIKGMKIENEIVVNPPQIIVKGTDPKMIQELAKALTEALKGLPKPDIVVKPAKVEVKEREFKLPKVFQVAGLRGFIKSAVDLMKELRDTWKGYKIKEPLPVVLTFKGKTYEAKGGEGIGVMGGPSRIYIRNKNNATADLVESATGLTVYNVVLTVANTEYSQLLPEDTRRFKIYALQSDKVTPLRDVLKYVLGGDTGHGNDWSAVDHIPIPAGGFNEQSEVRLRGKTLYFQSPTAGAIVIIEAWT